MTANAALGAHLQPFAGIPTFMRQPASRELAGADVCVMGVPVDSGVSHRPGCRFGPRKIRELSLLLWGYNNVLGVAPLDHLRLVDYGDVNAPPVDLRAAHTAIEVEAAAVLEAGCTLLALGGDHSISLPLLRAHARRHGALAVVHFDAHPDCWESEFAGHPYSHGTPFRHALQEGLIDPAAYVQIGIRGSTSSANDYADARALGARIITADEAQTRGVPAVLAEVQAQMGRRKVYVSMDIDSADPAYAPGTGTPEVGGFSSRELLQYVRGLRDLHLVGFDIVEVSPPYDHGDITAVLAANLAFEFLSLLALQHKQG